MYETYSVGDTCTWGDPKLNPLPDPFKTTDSGSYSDAIYAPETYDTIVFVHGWRMTPEDRRDYADHSYKRLFWQGFKGRFYSFGWPTEMPTVLSRAGQRHLRSQ